jgi:hypothetical protein
MYGCQCPKRLYLHKFHPELRDPFDEEQAAIFQQGTDIGALARDLFPGGANAQDGHDWHSHVTAAITGKLLPVYPVVYEAAFMHDEVLCAVDILVRKGRKYYAFEVKATNSVKPQHITDAALQYYVLRNSGIDLADFSILHLNREYVRHGPLDTRELFTATSVSEHITDATNEISARIASFKQLLAARVVPQQEIGEHCSKPYPCDFTGHCHGPAPQPEPAGYDPRVLFNRDEVGTFISGVQHPLHFLDFETVMYAIPQFDHSSPYQQIPFQYSLHRRQAPGMELLHTAFLGDGVNDPREEFICKLLADLGSEGTILVWNVSFERGCIQRLAVNFPQYADELHALVPRMQDLMDPFRRKHVYSEAFEGSYSIKKVLPVIAPDLRYQDLAVQEGTMASGLYSQLKDLREEDLRSARTNLLDYCHLDTLAMVRIWDYLIKEMA